MNKPILSVVIPTYNSEIDLQNIFNYLVKQSISKNSVEFIVSDGGSKDKTREIAEKYKAQIVNNPDRLAEPGIFHGMNVANSDLIMVLAVDNIFEDTYALEKMVSVFDNKDIFAAFPKHASSRDDNLFTKYVNTFTDPFNHFIYGLASNARTFNHVYKTITHNTTYDIYDYSSSNIFPMIAIAQGFTVRRQFVNSRKEKMDDLVSVMQLIKDGRKIAYVHNVLLFHHTIRNMNHFIRKQQWATKNALENKNYGIALRKGLLTNWQKYKIKYYPIYSFSLILPVMYSIINFLRWREPLWLFHPIINIICALAISKQIIIMRLGNKSAISRL